MREQQADAAARPAQRRLAWAATASLHGEDEAEKARVASEALFGRGTGGDDGDQALHVIAESSDIPVHAIAPADFGDRMLLLDVLVRCGLASSKADARRGIQGRGYYINDEQVTDVDRWLTADDFGGREWVLLRKGKKNYVKLVVSPSASAPAASGLRPQ